jgi:uncharacterized iron-regulated protein
LQPLFKKSEIAIKILIFLSLVISAGCMHAKLQDQNSGSSSAGTASVAEKLSPDSSSSTSHINSDDRSKELLFPEHLRKASVILVGETHYYTPIESYDYLLRGFRNEKNFCLAVEFPKSPKPFSLSLLDLSARIESYKKAKRDEHDIQRMEQALRTYKKIYQEARAYGMRVYGIDDEDHYDSELNVEERNEEMAKNIITLISNAGCKRVLAIVGKAHLTMGIFRKATIKGLLTAKALDNVTVNLQMTNEGAVPYAYQAFELSGVESPQGNFKWIENVSMRKMVRVLPHIENDLTVWQEFDWTLLIPENIPAQKF